MRQCFKTPALPSPEKGANIIAQNWKRQYERQTWPGINQRVVSVFHVHMLDLLLQKSLPRSYREEGVRVNLSRNDISSVP